MLLVFRSGDQRLKTLARAKIWVQTLPAMVDEPIDLFRARLRPPARNQDTGQTDDIREPEVFFDRRELQTILNVYGRMVSAGEWRDYGINTSHDAVAFAVYRRTAEFPLYRIEKRPKLRNRQGMYSVITVTGLILKRGHDLAQVLTVLEPKRAVSVD